MEFEQISNERPSGNHTTQTKPRQQGNLFLNYNFKIYFRFELKATTKIKPNRKSRQSKNTKSPKSNSTQEANDTTLNVQTSITFSPNAFSSTLAVDSTVVVTTAGTSVMNSTVSIPLTSGLINSVNVNSHLVDEPTFGTINGFFPSRKQHQSKRIEQMQFSMDILDRRLKNMENILTKSSIYQAISSTELVAEIDSSTRNTLLKTSVQQNKKNNQIQNSKKRKEKENRSKKSSTIIVHRCK